MDLLDRPLADQAAAIASGEADAAELLDGVLGRIEERNPAVNAVVDTFPERSGEMLAAAPEGPLRGVPVVIKDEFPLPWRAERCGAAENFVEPEPGESGPYRALRDAGAVIAGVANMHEWGASSTGNASVYGAARNPWDRDRCPGGSSSGSGAAVGARIVAGAVGVDGIGSIRYPSAYCGITGLKPTYGRPTVAGFHNPGSQTVVSGPMCSDAAGARLLGGVLMGEELAAGEATGLRIGVVDAPVATDCSDDVRAACEAAISTLADETGARMETIELEGLELATTAAVLIGSAQDFGEATAERLNAIGDEISPINKAMCKYLRVLPASVLARAEIVRTMLRHSLARAFERVDVIAWPASPAVAPPLEDPTVQLPSGPLPADPANARAGGLANLTGIPAISLPAGFGEGGMPVGLQLQAAWGRDELLLDAAEALERATERRWVDALSPAAGGEPAAA